MESASYTNSQPIASSGYSMSYSQPIVAGQTPQMYTQAPPQTSNPKSNGASALGNVVRFLAMITGPLLMAFGILRIVYVTDFRLTSLLMSIYIFFFGGLVFFAEFKWNKFLVKFPFMMTRRSRSLFIAFSGTFCLGWKIGNESWPGYASGIWCIVVGIMYFLLPCFVDDPDEEELKEQYSTSFENGQTAYPPVVSGAGYGNSYAYAGVGSSAYDGSALNYAQVSSTNDYGNGTYPSSSVNGSYTTLQ
ncbi:putative COPI associated protein [Monocercomonoides exilis]|uniref:putative COPI associated protein n=1 Tax=Monocercomonoides exilis TaxID=2049356 RepID=UPI003559ADE8|nr:putative COPI associated protein [Monocercomonoides exilis]|eukprot:MONOS_7185.1-p1 / transcript=MONOS_7185.1 / gene=MONOS_7185 / organism=Monocercomonoides_exilis_PA203 / gene_product=unspecified product / transcript_product=unspecified product / location=Mono_scaffold00240:9680-10643(+) / protein_length=246 / sequence_SO=supercontig / SO=protein_coding / is_pseudo=false